MESGQLFSNLVVPKNIKFSQIYKALVLLFDYNYWFIYRDKYVERRFDFARIIDDIDILEGCRIDCYEFNYFQIYMNI